MRFLAKKNAGCPKAPCDFPPRKDGILCPRWVVLGLPSPSHRVCGRTDVRMYGCTDVRTDGHVTITSQPKFLALTGYHISLAMELRWRALPAGSAINDNRWEQVWSSVQGDSLPPRTDFFCPFCLLCFSTTLFKIISHTGLFLSSFSYIQYTKMLHFLRLVVA